VALIQTAALTVQIESTNREELRSRGDVGGNPQPLTRELALRGRREKPATGLCRAGQ